MTECPLSFLLPFALGPASVFNKLFGFRGQMDIEICGGGSWGKWSPGQGDGRFRGFDFRGELQSATLAGDLARERDARGSAPVTVELLPTGREEIRK